MSLKLRLERWPGVSCASRSCVFVEVSVKKDVSNPCTDPECCLDVDWGVDEDASEGIRKLVSGYPGMGVVVPVVTPAPRPSWEATAAVVVLVIAVFVNLLGFWGNGNVGGVEVTDSESESESGWSNGWIMLIGENCWMRHLDLNLDAARPKKFAHGWGESTGGMFRQLSNSSFYL